MNQAERRLYLIHTLLSERPSCRRQEIPKDAARQRVLLRGLMNVRPAKQISPEFLSVQDEYLRAELAQKGVTVLESLTPAARCGEAALYLWQGDITTLQCDAIVNAANIASMKDGAILLNLARGPLLDEAAVAEALASGKLGGLGADVVSVEPIAQDNPLLASPNTLLTPHIAWATRTARQNITRIIAENIAGWMAGQPKSVVNKAYLNG